MTNWSTRAKLVYARTYSRPKENGSFETWEETINRVVSHQEWLWHRAKRNHLNAREKAELEELRQLLLTRKVFVAGRTMWLGGTDIAKRREISNFNCSALEVSSAYDMVDLLWLLLNGSGVGFIPKSGLLNGFACPIEKIEIIHTARTAKGGRETNKDEFDPDTATWTLTIGDSAEAWAKSIGKLLAKKYPAKKLVLDFTELRPGGERLKGYGWIAQGDELLGKAYVAIANILNKRAGQLLSAIDIMDIANWLGTILSTRRSAEIALVPYGSPEWETFARAKTNYWLTGNEQRAQSNNSLMFYSKPSRGELENIFDIMKESGGSEPGLINASAALQRAPYFTALNPCFTEDTLIHTKGGTYPIKDLVGKSVQVFDGTKYVTINNFRVTGHNQPILEVELQDGSVVKTTPNHTFYLEDGTKLEAKALQVGQKLQLHEEESSGKLSIKAAYLKGFLLGDGMLYENYKPLLWLYPPKYVCQEALLESAFELSVGKINTNAIETLGFSQQHDRKLMQGLTVRKEELVPWCKEYKSGLPSEIFQWDLKSKLEFIKGFFDADGSHVDSSNGFSYQITSISKRLLLDFQNLLKTVGVFGKLSLMHKAALREMPGGTYQCQDCWRLTISQKSAVKLSSQVAFERLPSFANRDLIYNVKPRWNKIVSIRSGGIAAKVYCCTVPGSHKVALGIGIVTGQCSEQLLPNMGLCNLCEVNLSAFTDDWAGLLRATELIARANYRQTCVSLDDGILQRAWHENNEFFHLCGVGLTGIVMRPDLASPFYLRHLRNAAVTGAHGMANQLGLPVPKHVTTIKPSGSVSKVGDCTEGIHKPMGRYIFNNINFSKFDPLIRKLEAAGYAIHQHPLDPSGVYVTFPVDWSGVEFAKVGSLEVNTESALAQLERYRLYMNHYVDTNASITVSYSPEEIPFVVEWLDRNWDSYVGVSFLPRIDPTKTAEDLGYPYLPQSVVDKETYHKYTSTLKEIDLVNGSTELLDDEACATGACPIR